MKRQDKEINGFILDNLYPTLSNFLEHVKLDNSNDIRYALCNHADRIMNELYEFDGRPSYRNNYYRPRYEHRVRYDRPRQGQYRKYKPQYERPRYEPPRCKTRQLPNAKQTTLWTKKIEPWERTQEEIRRQENFEKPYRTYRSSPSQ